jgi:hypothetical protein
VCEKNQCIRLDAIPLARKYSYSDGHPVSPRAKVCLEISFVKRTRKCVWQGKDATLSGDEYTSRSSGSAAGCGAKGADAAFVNWPDNGAVFFGASCARGAYQP